MGSGFHNQQLSGLNPHIVCFQSSVRDSKSDMIKIGGDYSTSSTSSTGFTGIGNSCDSIVVDSGTIESRNHHRGGLAVEWSVEEQHKLEQAYQKYADEPGIIRYVKIAATLRNKTVRDVALRCQWMTRKRRKHEDLNLWKKSMDKKDKPVESSLTPGVSSVSTINVIPFSVSVNHQVRGGGINIDALQDSIRQLLQQNNQVLGQISTNICALKLQDNISLFSQTKNNITAILNDMRCLPGSPLPVSLNEDLANRILSFKSQLSMNH
uniref:uncharacterized protein LOC122579994 isoform X2 n=1 Tax=Erigeron canadensis TaxID=72917 RepID=UPI001CB96C53|nr:uncharacterized protein LOC122579994 isoform X2 [Erigeron canadensis]